MTKQEFFGIMTNMRMIYLNAFNNQSDEQFKAICANWYRFFKDDDYQTVSNALDRYIATNTSGFPPTPAQIKEMMMEVSPIIRKTVGEAWEMVHRSARCDYQLAKEQFGKLSPNIQKAVGSIEFLTDLGYADDDRTYYMRKEFENKYNQVLSDEKKDVASGVIKIDKAHENNMLPHERKLLKE